jgi:hypothetical protein
MVCPELCAITEFDCVKIIEFLEEMDIKCNDEYIALDQRVIKYFSIFITLHFTYEYKRKYS